MNLNNAISSAEKEFREILEKFFISVYDESLLPSHNIEHHRRVWRYAKELLPYYIDMYPHTPGEIPKKLIVACYVHDIGMARDPGIRHGHHSSNLCRRFLRENHLKESEFNGVLSAIEYHDKKEYNSSGKENDILKILSVADDLDAFGYTGIYRYAEIYLKRGIQYGVMGNLIRENARQRFEYFVSIFMKYPGLFRKHRRRYRILDNFFDRYNQQLHGYNFGNSDPTGYCGVVEIISQSIDKHLTLQALISGNKMDSKDIIIKNFLTGLENEISG